MIHGRRVAILVAEGFEQWVDKEVVTDRGLVSSRKPADIPAFARKLIAQIEEGSHAGRARPGSEREQRAPR